MKLHDVLNTKNRGRDLEYEFERLLNEFNSIYLPNGRINGFGNVIIVTVQEIMDWIHPQHHRLCQEFGLNLFKIEKREMWNPDKRGYSLQVDYFYVDEQDTNFKELDLQKVKL